MQEKIAGHSPLSPEKQYEQVCLPPDVHILSCRVFESEFKALGIKEDQVRYLDMNLHTFPKDLRLKMGEALDEIENIESINTVILGFGYCGGGLEDLSTKRVRIVLPLVHDCIPLLLGRENKAKKPGEPETFYLSAGWVDHGATPLTEFNRTVERHDLETARWVSREILKAYDSVSVIDNGLIGEPHYMEYANEMAELNGLACKTVSGSMVFLARLLQGMEAKGVVVIPPGQPIKLEMYLDAGAPMVAAVS